MTQVVRLHQLLHEVRFDDPKGNHLSPAGELGRSTPSPRPPRHCPRFLFKHYTAHLTPQHHTAPRTHPICHARSRRLPIIPCVAVVLLLFMTFNAWLSCFRQASTTCVWA